MKKGISFIAIIIFAISIFTACGEEKYTGPRDEFYGAQVRIDTVNAIVDGKMKPYFIEKISNDKRFYLIQYHSDNGSLVIPVTNSFKSAAVGDSVILVSTRFQMNSNGAPKDLYEVFPFPTSH